MSKKIQGPAGAYYHIGNPYRFFSTQSEALADLGRLRRSGFLKPRKARVPTFYTILQDKRKKNPLKNPLKFGNVPQGPHTFPHHGIFRGIAAANEAEVLDDFGDLFVLTPKRYADRVKAEIGPKHAKRKRAEVAIQFYEKAYDGYIKLREKTGRSEKENIKFAHRINRLRNLDPWATYGYKGTGAGRSALKGKGESSKKPLSGQLDIPRNSGFSDNKAVEADLKLTVVQLGYFGVE